MQGANPSPAREGGPCEAWWAGSAANGLDLRRIPTAQSQSASNQDCGALRPADPAHRAIARSPLPVPGRDSASFCTGISASLILQSRRRGQVRTSATLAPAHPRASGDPGGQVTAREPRILVPASLGPRFRGDERSACTIRDAILSRTRICRAPIPPRNGEGEPPEGWWAGSAANGLDLRRMRTAQSQSASNQDCGALRPADPAHRAIARSPLPVPRRDSALFCEALP